jgi:hypothetical protein
MKMMRSLGLTKVSMVRRLTTYKKIVNRSSK